MRHRRPATRARRRARSAVVVVSAAVLGIAAPGCVVNGDDGNVAARSSSEERPSASALPQQDDPAPDPASGGGTTAVGRDTTRADDGTDTGHATAPGTAAEIPPSSAAAPGAAAPAPTSTTTPAAIEAAPEPAAVAAAEVADDPGTADLELRVVVAYDTTIPHRWRHTVTGLGLKGGDASWAYPDGRILISEHHANGDWERLRAVVAHEVGHAIAFRYGSGAYHGAGPADFDAPAGLDGAERWSNCVAAALTGYTLRSSGPSACDDAGARWALEWLTR